MTMEGIWQDEWCNMQSKSCCRPAHAVHFAVYEAAKKGLGKTTAETSFVGAAAAGATATIISDACMTPFDVIKQRLQVTRTCMHAT